MQASFQRIFSWNGTQPLASRICFKEEDDMQEQSKALATSRDLGHSLSASVCWPSLSGELPLLLSETLGFHMGLSSVCVCLVFALDIFRLSFWLCCLLELRCSQSFCGWQQRDCYHSNIFQLQARTVICCEQQIEQNRPSVLLIREMLFPGILCC